MSISYAIGKAEPTAVEIDTFGTARVDEDVIRLAVLDVFDLRPAAIMSLLHLRAPIYADTAAYGHFNGYKFSWENLDKSDRQLRFQGGTPEGGGGRCGFRVKKR